MVVLVTVKVAASGRRAKGSLTLKALFLLIQSGSTKKSGRKMFFASSRPPLRCC
jgi:hypothetical protein